MKQSDAHESKFDMMTGLFLDDFAQRISRRGILARLGKLALNLMGVTLVPHLPIDRTFVVEAQTTPCGDWRLCGIYGNLCKACCGVGDSLTSCPPCTVTGGFWTKCCLIPSEGACEGSQISYIDCCGGPSEAANCQGTFCPSGAPQPAWCAGTYRCTIIAVGPSCFDFKK